MSKNQKRPGLCEHGIEEYAPCLACQLAEAEKSSDHYEQKCGQLQRELNQVNKSFQEYVTLATVDACDAAYARSCPRCQKLMKRKAV